MYTVEGWAGHAVVGAATRTRPAAVIRLATHYALDKGADTVWIRRDGHAVYTFDGLFWRKHRGDAALEEALAREE